MATLACQKCQGTLAVTEVFRVNYAWTPYITRHNICPFCWLDCTDNPDKWFRDKDYALAHLVELTLTLETRL